MRKHVVALVGRPNVGKSTLFNRLVGERMAIVDDVPGTTRDRLLSESDWAGHEFFVVDTGGIDPTKMNKQKPLSIGSVNFIKEIRIQAEIAIDEADVILFVVDAISGVTTADHEVAEILRRKQRIINGQESPPIILVVNKADSKTLRLNAT
ncbi:MAG: 50S ribosome-binding GTPase, partial [Anaerolineaceae bacterium]|nr:50S ribosome-binding GTPase [Anaerolineaceae bacterium]